MSLACRRRMIFMMSRGGGGSCFLVFLLGKVKGSGATVTGDDRDTNCNDAKGLYYFPFLFCGSMVILNEGVCLVVDALTYC